MKTIFAILSAAFSIALFALGANFVLELGLLSSENQRVMGHSVSLVLVSAAAFEFASIRAMTWGLLMAGAFALRRGKSYVNWSAPSRCRTVFHWIFTTWGVYDHNGPQEGVRVFGLEASLQGSLRS